MQVKEERRSHWLDRPLLSSIRIDWETVIFAIIILLVIFTRFYNLESRVMSHDETTHVYFSWKLFKGQGYQHAPLSHGPLQFHLVALSYFLFGDNDFTARIPAAIFSIAAVVFLWNYRRYLGRIGALVAAGLFLISPFMLYYGRYVRNEIFAAFFGLVTLWAILRYLETGTSRYLYYLSAVTALHFAAKETSFIYTAQALLFLGFLFLQRVSTRPWKRKSDRDAFLFFLLAGLILFAIALGVGLISYNAGTLSAAETLTPVDASQGSGLSSTLDSLSPTTLVFGALGVMAFLMAVFYLVRGLGIKAFRQERSFDLIVLLGTLVLPHLSAFPIRWAGWDPLDYSSMDSMLHVAAFLVPMILIALAIGLWWNARLWLQNNAIFYAIFTVLFTTVFTNGAGFFTGLVGSLGYWLEQQGVQRGSQPWYYYLLVQVPVYEYLAALGTLLAGALGLRGLLRRRQEPSRPTADSQEFDADYQMPPAKGRSLALQLFGFWTVTSLLAYSIAGEKMPWLTVHIALPMLLLAGWAFGRLIESVDWAAFRVKRGWLTVLLLVLFLSGLGGTLAALFGRTPPFQGQELDQLQATSRFLLSLIVSLLSGWGLSRLLSTWRGGQILRVGMLAVFAFLALLTARAAAMAAYINYDDPTELLVYAHSASGPKQALERIEEISLRTTDGLGLAVAYDNETTYPYWWYLRNYYNQRYYGATPTRDLQELPVILVGEPNYSRIEPVVGDAYYRFDYHRIWWPNQDYFNLTWERIWNALTDPQMRAALFQIWLNRDYSLYGQITGKDFSLPNWSPAVDMRMYVRKDVVAKLWEYGVGPAVEEVVADPYEGKQIELSPDLVIGTSGAGEGEFNAPHGIALAPDGSFYVADTDNHRIQHFAADGTFLNQWGSYASVDVGEAPGGTFYQPWGLAVGSDGSVYVADTWNHRIQKFTAEGEFLTMWGTFEQGDLPNAFWGPRDIAIDQYGNLLITDTGNKRVAIYDSDGNYLSSFGGAGLSLGQLDEPVGIAINPITSQVYIADTWNQRIQVFEGDSQGDYYPIISWDINGWFGQSLENKPYLAIDGQGNVYATDPELGRVLVFSSTGEFLYYWGADATSSESFGLASALAFDGEDGLWVSDGSKDRLLHFTLPQE